MGNISIPGVPSSPVTSISAVYLYTKFPVTNVRFYGAAGDGVTDDTIAVQAAFDASYNVYFPQGTYVLSNITIANDGTHIFGDGNASVLSFKTGSTGKMIEASTKKIYINDLRLTGGVATDYKTNGITTVVHDRSGLSLSSAYDSRVFNVTFDGFENIGLYVNDSTTQTLLDRFLITNCSFRDNFVGVDTGLNGENYGRYSDLNITRCGYAFLEGTGNVNLNSSNIYENYYGIYLDGTRLNNAHGNVNNCLLNHNTYPIYAKDVSNGHTFVGNQIFDGTIYIKNCKGISIVDGTIDVVEFQLAGIGVNYIMNNHCCTNWANTITHNYEESTDQTLFINNWLDNYTFLENRSSIFYNRISDGVQNPAAKIDLNFGNTTDTDSINLGTYNMAGNVGGGVLWKSNYPLYTKISAAIRQVGEDTYFRSGIAFYTGNNSDESTNAVERMRINMNGRVGIGTASPSNYADLTLYDGKLCIKETTTPTADANYGKIYTKSDNKLYFQDGDGTEHEVKFV